MNKQAIIDGSVFTWLISPIGKECFLSEYWEKKPLVISNRDKNRFKHLLSVDEVDRVITTLNIRYPNIFLTNSDEEVTKDQYITHDNIIDVSKLYQLFSSGSTIGLNGLHKILPALSNFCRSLEKELSFRTQSNVYFSPSDGKGLKPHYDSHDVFVLQISGSKHWYIYDTPIELPLSGQEFDSSITKPGEITKEFDLHSGDLLYIPRGIMHDARSKDSDSLHITIGVHVCTWADLMIEALSEACLNDSNFRKSIPIGYADWNFDKESVKNDFNTLLQRFSNNANINVALDSLADEFSSNRRLQLQGQVHQLSKIGELDIDSIVSARPDLIYRVYEDNEFILINFQETELSLPIYTKTPLIYALDNESFSVNELPGELDDSGKITLVKRLVKEGLMVIK